MNPPIHHPSPIFTILLTSSIPTTLQHIILVNHLFPNLFLTNRPHKSQIGFAKHCCVSLTFSPENSPGGKLIPETGNQHTWGFQLENSVGMKDARCCQKEKSPTRLPGYAKVSWEAHGPARLRDATRVRVYVLRVCLIKGWFMFPGAGVSFYFWAVISPLKVQNSSAPFESMHSLLFLVREWPEIVSIVIDLNFHFDDGNKYFSRPSLRNKFFHSSPSNQSLRAKRRAESAKDRGANRTSLPPSSAWGPGAGIGPCFMAAHLAPVPCLLSQMLPKLWPRVCRYSSEQDRAGSTLMELNIYNQGAAPSPTLQDFSGGYFPTLTNRNSPQRCSLL